jgi:hypothetical protein
MTATSVMVVSTAMDPHIRSNVEANRRLSLKTGDQSASAR